MSGQRTSKAQISETSEGCAFFYAPQKIFSRHPAGKKERYSVPSNDSR